MNPTVSICIPTYNGSKYLPDCFDSVLAQTFTDFEVLIVDDCSSDETVSITKEYTERDRRFRLVINERNLGLVGNWNRCIELARGEWIKFVFQDDLIKPICLERMLAASTPKSVILTSRRDYLFDAEILETKQKDEILHIEKIAIDLLFPGVTEISAQDYCEVTLDRPKDNFVGEPTSVMLHRSVFSRFGFFNPYLIHYCDFEFWTRIAIHTGITYIPEQLTIFRVHNNSQSKINMGSGKYRATILDLLIIMHDFAFHPAYVPLREAACRRQMNLTNLLAEQAYNAKRMAERAAIDSVNPDPSQLAEWNKMLQFYPLFATASKRSFAKRLIIHGLYRWKQLQRQVKKLLKFKI
jgi:glycosyltransferase involved in cell wall biosynthesis